MKLFYFIALSRPSGKIGQKQQNREN